MAEIGYIGVDFRFHDKLDSPGALRWEKPGRIALSVFWDGKRKILRKSFVGVAQAARFFNELSCLHLLKSCDGVPKVRYVDYEKSAIYMDFIKGTPMSWRPGRGRFDRTKWELTTIGALFGELLGEIHARGVLIYDIQGSNMILSQQRPFFIDFADSIYLSPRALSWLGCERQREMAKLVNVMAKYQHEVGAYLAE